MKELVIPRITATAGLKGEMDENILIRIEVTKAIGRFLKNDWGIIDKEDHRQNDIDLKERDGRLLAKYQTAAGDIYITRDFGDTEKEDIITTMFCEEY